MTYKLPRQDSKITTFNEFRMWLFHNIYGPGFERFWKVCWGELREQFKISKTLLLSEKTRARFAKALSISDRPRQFTEEDYSQFIEEKINMETNMEKLRTNKGWSREKLADKSGISLSEIKKMEIGKGEIPFGNIVKVAIALDVGYNEISYTVRPNDMILSHIKDIQSHLNKCWKRYKTFPTHNLFCQTLEKESKID